MKVGDLVRHFDGDKGIVIAVDSTSNYPYKVRFFTSKNGHLAQADWFIDNVLEVISESR